MTDLLPEFREWLFAIAALLLTLIVAPAVRAFLGRWKNHRNFNYVGRLAIPASYLVYPLGLRATVEFAPLHPKAEVWAEDAVYVLFVVIFLNLVRQAALMAVEFSSLRVPKNAESFQQGFVPLMRNIITLVIFLMGGIMLLKYFGYDVMSLITALGVGSLAVGLAAKDTLSNMISGFTLIIDRNLRPGDKINLGGSVGVVDEIGLRSTRLNIRDGNVLIVPNQDLVNTKIMNMSMEGPESACSTRFRIPLDVTFERIQKICLDIFPSVAKSIPNRGGWVQVSSIFEGHQVISAGFWCIHSDSTGESLSDFHVRLIERCKREGILLLGPAETILKG